VSEGPVVGMRSESARKESASRGSGASTKTAEVRNGLCLVFDDLGEGAVISTAHLAYAMKVSDVTVTRMIARGELPQPVPMGRWHVWTVGWLIRWVETRLEAAAQEEQLVRKQLA